MELNPIPTQSTTTQTLQVIPESLPELTQFLYANVGAGTIDRILAAEMIVGFRKHTKAFLEPELFLFIENDTIIDYDITSPYLNEDRQ